MSVEVEKKEREININFESKHNLDILHTLGEREDATISQKAITREFNNLSKTKLDKTGGSILDKFGNEIISIGSDIYGSNGFATKGTYSYKTSGVCVDDFVGLLGINKDDAAGVFPLQTSGTQFKRLIKTGFGFNERHIAISKDKVQVIQNKASALYPDYQLAPIEVGAPESENDAVSLKICHNIAERTVLSAYYPVDIRFHNLRSMARLGQLETGFTYRIIDYSLFPAHRTNFAKVLPESIFNIIVTAKSRFEIFEEAWLEWADTSIVLSLYESGIDISKFKIKFSLEPIAIKNETVYNIDIESLLAVSVTVGLYKDLKVIYSPCGYLAVDANNVIAYELKPIVPLSDITFNGGELDRSQWQFDRPGTDGLMFLGEITWMQDDLGNEAPFDFYQLGWNMPIVEEYISQTTGARLEEIVNFPIDIPLLFPSILSMRRSGISNNKITDIPSFAMIFGGNNSKITTNSVMFVANYIENSTVYINGDTVVRGDIINSNMINGRGFYSGIIDSDIRNVDASFRVYPLVGRNVINGIGTNIDKIEPGKTYHIGNDGILLDQDMFVFYIKINDTKIPFCAKNGASWLTWVDSEYSNGAFSVVESNLVLYEKRPILTKSGLHIPINTSIEAGYEYLLR